jgi:hypothetical protein
MNARWTKTLITLTAVTAFAVPAGALASQGADDPAGHEAGEVHHNNGHHRARHHAERQHGADARHGADDGPNHT